MPEYESYVTYLTVDYELLFIFAFQSKNDPSQVSTLEPERRITGSMLHEESMQLSNQFIIYQTSVPQLNFMDASCDKFYNGSGFYCDIGFSNTTGDNFP